MDPSLFPKELMAYASDLVGDEEVSFFFFFFLTSNHLSQQDICQFKSCQFGAFISGYLFFCIFYSFAFFWTG